MDLITSLTSQVVNKALTGLSMRHKALSSNLANVDTPNYKRREVSFEASLEKAIVEAKSSEAEKLSRQRHASIDEEITMKATRSEHFGSEAFGGPGGLAGIQPEITQTESTEFRNDGNSVDVESEMVHLAKNTQRYIALTNIQGRLGRTLRSVITNAGG